MQSVRTDDCPSEIGGYLSRFEFSFKRKRFNTHTIRHLRQMTFSSGYSLFSLRNTRLLINGQWERRKSEGNCRSDSYALPFQKTKLRWVPRWCSQTAVCYKDAKETGTAARDFVQTFSLSNEINLREKNKSASWNRKLGWNVYWVDELRAYRHVFNSWFIYEWNKNESLIILNPQLPLGFINYLY